MYSFFSASVDGENIELWLMQISQFSTFNHIQPNLRKLDFIDKLVHKCPNLKAEHDQNSTTGKWSC